MDVLPLVALVAGSAAIAGVARRTPVPAPLLLVAAGLVAAYLPGVPPYTLDPHIVLPLLLPPLLHTAAVDSSYLDLRSNIRPMALLSVGYVLFATIAVGYTAYLLVPGLSLPGRAGAGRGDRAAGRGRGDRDRPASSGCRTGSPRSCRASPW